MRPNHRDGVDRRAAADRVVVTAPEEPAEPPESDLAYEVRRLLRLIDHEIGRRWCSLELRLQLEAVEYALDRQTDER